jgi:hypothetical protein
VIEIVQEWLVHALEEIGQRRAVALLSLSHELRVEGKWHRLDAHHPFLFWNDHLAGLVTRRQ